MQYKKEGVSGSFIIILSGVVILAAQFVNWTANETALDLFELASFDIQFYLYIVPLFSGVIICIIGVLLVFENTVFKKLSFILIIIVLNLLFFFLAEAIGYHGKYIWNYNGIYVLIIGCALFFIGLLNSLLGPAKNQ